ncbi:MarR family winged helix-turn-helix transcriptional regulator [Rhodococcus gannanensis]|uniref:MarR family winged helix-turn-helix transcriptional regulator n=1 Tax=Rhodococcus gannanensis TaxID=1960308 RepID=A0ABW4NZA5_9NOCA
MPRDTGKAGNVNESLVPASVAEHPGCVLLKLGQVAFRLTEQRLGELGLRTRHYTLLKVLAADGPLSQLELGRRTRIDATTIVATVDDLEKAGLATRTRDKADRRRWSVALTDDGSATAGRADALIERLGREMFTDLSTTQSRDLADLLGALNTGTALAGLLDGLRG